MYFHVYLMCYSTDLGEIWNGVRLGPLYAGSDTWW